MVGTRPPSTASFMYAVAHDDVVEIAELLIFFAVGAEESGALVGSEVGGFVVEIEEGVDLLAGVGERLKRVEGGLCEDVDLPIAFGELSDRRARPPLPLATIPGGVDEGKKWCRAWEEWA